MKQRISAEDLAELSPEQQERLREWWEPQIGDMSLSKQGIPKVYVGDITQKERNTPLLSIGQCIELLDYLKQCLVIRKKRGIWNCEETWGNSKVELIDALWQAVKEVL